MTFEQNIISAIDSQKGWMSRPAIKTYLAKNCGFVDTPMNKVHLKKALAKFEKKGDSYKVQKTQRKSSGNKEKIAARKAKVAAKAAGAAALGAAMTLSSVPAFAAPGDSIRRTEPVARKEAADESSTTQLKYSYTNMPWEDLETSTAKFAPKTNWNTLYPEKRLRLEKKSPVARKDLAPAGNFETYAKTYPGLYSALSGLPMGETTPFLGAKPAEPPADDAAKK